MYELENKRQTRRRTPNGNQTGNQLWQGVVSGMVAFVAAVVLALSIGLIAYAMIATTLPKPEELESSANALHSTYIYDRDGNLLSQLFNPDDVNAGRRTIVPLSQIPEVLQKATISTEDANFYEHSGIDPVALLRALYYAVRTRDLVSGASTIPQQLVKMVFLSPERSATRKIKEAILSTEISRQYDKDKILEIYLNKIYYGNLAYGAEAAAKTYFNKDVKDLTLAEASLLAGLPQLPAYYDPYTHPDRARKRQMVVLQLMVKAGAITEAEADSAWNEPLSYAPLQEFKMEAPHFTLFVRQQLEELFSINNGADYALFQQGVNVYTTLNSKLQEQAQTIVHDQVAGLADHNVSNGALVAMDPRTGEILALVGSADFNNVEIDGQVNMALAPRQPGSTIKPLVYLASFEQPNKQPAERWNSGTLVADIKEAFPDGANPPYVPTNYDNKERGMVTVRTALANSLNIPAVRTMQTIGVANFLPTVPRLGIDTLTRTDYGLSLALGAGEVPLVEMVGAFGVLANQGKRMPPVTIKKITDSSGRIICELGTATPCQANGDTGQQVVNPVDAFLITDIISDNEARSIAFGLNSYLQLGNRPVAAKTGTTNDFRDVLTMGYTPQLVTGVWVGNADDSPMVNVTGITGAAPIWNQFMQTALADQPIMEFTPPPGVRQFEVCADTGTLPSEACPQKRSHWFAEDRPPLPKEKDLYQKVRLDKTTGKLANEFTPQNAIEEKVFKVYPPQYRKWAEEHGIAQPPADASDVYTFKPEIAIREPVTGEVVSGIVTVRGIANAPAFASYELQYGVSHNPGAFSPPFAGSNTPVLDGELGQWDTSTLGDGPHTLRLVVHDTHGNAYEAQVHLFVGQPTPTWTPLAATETWTPAPSTETPTETPTSAEPPPTSAEPPPTAIVPDTPVPPTDAVPAPPTDTPLPVPPTDTPVSADTPTWTPVALETPTLQVTGTITASNVVTGSSLITEGAEITP
ncbi:MAG: PBP1A family penicillin-binding protein [Chloroflexi bacterium]|nr:PBP1A family penicillin-binding protein [Chloroflexota bacterium]